MLKQRIITAIILIPLTLLALFYLPAPWFCFVTALVTLAATWEWTALMEVKTSSRRVLYLVLMAALFTVMLFIHITYIFAIAFLWWILALLLVVFYPRCASCWSKGVFWRGLMGFFVLAPCWAAINFLRNEEDGISSVIFLFVLIWGADSAAYFVGKKWGSIKLAPLVSPGKSVQGLIGALCFSILFVVAILWFIDFPSQFWGWCIWLSLLTVLFSILGDLFESMLKRQAGLKDSGNLLPGHGGLLDRIDSLTAAAPIFVLGSLVLGSYLH